MNPASIDCLDIGSRLELFTDRLLVDGLQGISFKMHEPRLEPAGSWMPAGHYMTLIQDTTWRAYYRQYTPGWTGSGEDGNEGEITCLAQSEDGIHWQEPDLRSLHGKAVEPGNMVFRWKFFSHNFAPFLDANPHASPDSRYKALAGVHQTNAIPGDGLHAFESPDGLRWSPMRSRPVIENQDFAFDSQNPVFWSSAEGCYVCYYRAWKTPHGKLRSINRVTSPDFIHWSSPIEMNPNLPGEHLYTSQVRPYFRAPHLYVALPTRFNPQRGSSTDILLMTTRAGSSTFDRLFTEAFIRPGLDPQRWGNRSNYAAAGIIPTCPLGREISIFHGPAGRRYTLRTDGFISLHAGATPGTATTRLFQFTGSSLELNVATSAAGFARVELQDAQGRPIPGRALEDCDMIYGDTIAHRVTWRANPDLSPWQRQPVRLKFELGEADLYALQFKMA